MGKKKKDYEELGKCLATLEKVTNKIISNMAETPIDSFRGFRWLPYTEVLHPEEGTDPTTENYYVYPVIAVFGEMKAIRYYAYGAKHWWNGPQQMDEYVRFWMPISFAGTFLREEDHG